jgi:hypothetical protein
VLRGFSRIGLHSIETLQDTVQSKSAGRAQICGTGLSSALDALDRLSKADALEGFRLALRLTPVRTGVVKTLTVLNCGPVPLVHTQKVGIK